MAEVKEHILGVKFFASKLLPMNMSNKHLISLYNFKVVATGIASTPTSCGLHVALIHSLDAIVDAIIGHYWSS